jgi:hypothetical protein
MRATAAVAIQATCTLTTSINNEIGIAGRIFARRSACIDSARLDGVAA